MKAHDGARASMPNPADAAADEGRKGVMQQMWQRINGCALDGILRQVSIGVESGHAMQHSL
jgi:hypothetical protein